MAILIIQCIVLSDQSLWRWLDSKPARYIGRISYPLYLFHQLPRQIIGSHPLGLGASDTVVTLVATLALAMTSYHILEMPFLRMKGRWQPLRTVERQTG